MSEQRIAYYRRRKRMRQIRKVLLTVLILVILLLVLITVVRRHRHTDSATTEEMVRQEVLLDENAPPLNVQLLTPNEYSRPQISLAEIRGIVVHYTANQGSSAQANRNYFEGLKDSREKKVSSHFVIGLEGEIIQCIPTSEIAYASNDRNSDTVSIECCYENEDGSFNQATYDSLVRLTAWLCHREGLSSEDVIRHYDVTGKMCPVYYVDHPEEWDRFRSDVQTAIDQM